MSILLDIRSPNWMTEEGLRDFLAPLLPGVAIHCDVETAPLAEIRMLTVSRLRPGIVGRLPNVELVQKLGAGVDTIVTSPELRAGIRVTRLAPDAPAREIAEYCLAYVLRDQRHLREYESDTTSRAWSPREPRQSVQTRVAVLGLGHIGARTARLFAALGFKVSGWSRSAKSIEGVACRAGADALPELLGEADYVVSILPSTPETRDLFDAAMLGRMKPGAILINAGRGDLIVEADLLDALDAGRPGGAVLDVFRQEPLPPDHPFWGHERVTVTPHVSGWHLDDGLKDVAENYRRLVEGEPLLHEIDRTLGY